VSKLPSTLSFFWGELWSLGDQKKVLQLLQSICFREKWPIASRFLNKKILKFEDLETRFKHVEKI
jgi:hypothetical protein